jgi:hypothetical protein
MNADKILQDIVDLSRRSGVTNSQFRKEVESMVSLALHGKDISGMSRKDRVKVMTNDTAQLDAYLKQEKEKAREEGED